MTKKKNTPSLYDRIVFRRDFTLSVDTPIESCVEGIRQMDDFRPKNFFDVRRQTATITPLDHDRVEFDIQRKRRNRGALLLSARAQGTLVDNGNRTTALYGEMRSGIWYILFIIFPAIIVAVGVIAFIGTDPFIGLYMLVVFGGALGIIAGILAKDRRDLRADLQAALAAEPASKRKPDVV